MKPRPPFPETSVLIIQLPEKLQMAIFHAFTIPLAGSDTFYLKKEGLKYPVP
jgi:hypothetical protein